MTSTAFATRRDTRHSYTPSGTGTERKPRPAGFYGVYPEPSQRAAQALQRVLADFGIPSTLDGRTIALDDCVRDWEQAAGIVAMEHATCPVRVCSLCGSAPCESPSACRAQARAEEVE